MSTTYFGKVCLHHEDLQGERYKYKSGGSICVACNTNRVKLWRIHHPKNVARQRTRDKNQVKKPVVRLRRNESRRESYHRRKLARENELAFGPSLRYNPGTEKPRKGY